MHLMKSVVQTSISSQETRNHRLQGTISLGVMFVWPYLDTFYR